MRAELKWEKRWAAKVTWSVRMTVPKCTQMLSSAQHSTTRGLFTVFLLFLSWQKPVFFAFIGWYGVQEVRLFFLRTYFCSWLSFRCTKWFLLFCFGFFLSKEGCVYKGSSQYSQFQSSSVQWIAGGVHAISPQQYVPSVQVKGILQFHPSSMNESTEPMWEWIPSSNSVGVTWVRIALTNAILLYALELHFQSEISRRYRRSSRRAQGWWMIEGASVPSSVLLLNAHLGFSLPLVWKAWSRGGISVFIAVML